ncbi:MAG: thiamine diphosphokinase [Clostridiales bacterium]|nr:thiamine diphosphokinase [Clostridiales bacterium]
MKTLILTGGNIEYDFALSFIEKLNPDYILGVDRGLQFCYENKILPDYIVGDFDSLPPEILQWYKEKTKVPIREYNPVKDASDTMIALENAMEKNSTEIWILGGIGTRLDHVMANIQIMKNGWMKKVPVYLADSRNLITLPVEQYFTIKKEEQFGTYVSFFPLEADVEGLTLKGFKYPLDRHHLRNQEGSLGVSNEITSETAEVSWEQGILVMIQSRD